MNDDAEQKASPPRASDTTVHTIHEVRCRDTGGRGVRLVVTDNIAVVKIALKGAEVVAEEMSIDFRDVLALNDTLLRGSQALTGLTPPPAPTERPGLAGSFPGAVDNDGSYHVTWRKGYDTGLEEGERRAAAARRYDTDADQPRPSDRFAEGVAAGESRAIRLLATDPIRQDSLRRAHWWWPFGKRERWTRWTRSIG